MTKANTFTSHFKRIVLQASVLLEISDAVQEMGLCVLASTKCSYFL